MATVAVQDLFQEFNPDLSDDEVVFFMRTDSAPKRVTKHRWEKESAESVLTRCLSHKRKLKAEER